MNMKNVKVVIATIVVFGALCFFYTKFMDKQNDLASQNNEDGDGVVIQKVWPCDRNSDCFYGPCSSSGLCELM